MIRPIQTKHIPKVKIKLARSIDFGPIATISPKTNAKSAYPKNELKLKEKNVFIKSTKSGTPAAKYATIKEKYKNINNIPVAIFPFFPKNFSAIERKLALSFIQKVTSSKRIPVSTINNHTTVVTIIPGKNPAGAVTKGIPSIPAPIVVPAIKKLPLKTLEKKERSVILMLF